MPVSEGLSMSFEKPCATIQDKTKEYGKPIKYVRAYMQVARPADIVVPRVEKSAGMRWTVKVVIDFIG